jgi:competence protein ComFC
MLKLNPQPIYGRWTEGFALDVHTVSSQYEGDDEFGHPKFNSVRSDVGEALYRLKYRNDDAQLPLLTGAAVAFLREWNPPVDMLVAVPPSKVKRTLVRRIAEAIAGETGIELSGKSGVRLPRGAELKNVIEPTEREKLLHGAFKLSASGIVADRVILLFDDLYRSGATMNELARVLRDDGGASGIYALTLTRTRRSG